MSLGAPTAHFEIAHTTWRHNYNISTNGRHVYYVDNSQMRIGKPDLTFHAGADNKSPVVGVIEFRHFSSDMEIGIGDPAHPSAMHWESLTRESVLSRKHAFRTKVHGHKRQFTWKRTHSMGEGHFGNLKLVDESNQAVIAVFSSRGAFTRQTGTLAVYANHGQEFDFMVLETCLAMKEKIRRTNNAAASGGGGGGGA